MAQSNFTVEHINEVFELYFKAHDELMEAVQFLFNMNLNPVKTWVTVRQASERTNTNKRTIQVWAMQEKIRSRRIGHSYEVVLEDVVNFASHRKKAV